MKAFICYLTLFLCIACEAQEEFILGLGSENYEKRESSSQSLRKMGFSALRSLRVNFDNEDLEVALMSRQIYEEYLDMGIESYPSIWYWDARIRFPEGIEARYNDAMSLCQLRTNRDIAAECFLEAKHVMDPDLTNWFDEEIFNCERWRNLEVERLASRILARKLLLSGVPKEEVDRLVREAQKNYEICDTMFQTKNLANKVWDFWGMPPGVLVLKEKFAFPSY